MWREVEPRQVKRERPDSRGRAGEESPLEVGDASGQPQDEDVFSRHLDLPRGTARERVRVSAHDYNLSGDDVRTLATVGAFRVVPASELRASESRTPTRPSRDVERLRDEGLVTTMPYLVGRNRTTLVTLTSRGRAVLESRRRTGSGEPRQEFYAGVSKPRELAH